METLEKRRWYRKSHSPKYLFNIIPVTVSRYNTRSTNNIPQFKVKHNFFWNSFFPSGVIEWNKLNLNIRNLESLNISKKSLLKFIRPSGSSVFNFNNLRGAKLLTRLKLGLSHLHQHKFKHGFQDRIKPICSCVNDIETSAHFLLHCPHYSNERSIFLNTIRNINWNIFDKNDLQITETFLFGDSSLNDKSNIFILNATIDFLFVTKRFEVNLLWIEYGCFLYFG